MGSRIRESPTHLFECFCEVVIPTKDEKRPWVLQKYPHDFCDEEILKSVPEFACPCEFTNNAVQHFSFVLTSIESKWTFGYCRHAPQSPTVFVLVSFLPWHETFYKLLNQISELAEATEAGSLMKFLDILYHISVPEPGFNLHIQFDQKELVILCPNHFRLPSIPENRNLTEYFNAVDADNMIIMFASMLHERRIMVTSKKLSRLSACVQAANSLIYPMSWQHIFIPVLPKHLLDYLSAPMPFLIGVPSNTLLHVKHNELAEVVMLDADNNRIKTPFNDVETLPTNIVALLKRYLKRPNTMLGDGVARAFMKALVRLIGGYRDALKLNLGEKISFDEEAFIQTRSMSVQPFLEKMLHLQIFQQFIQDRLEMLNSGIGFSDEFEIEVNSYAVNSSNNLRSQYKEWVTTMKKEGGAFIKNVKNKTNPAVKSAYKTVKDKGKKAYKDFRLKIHDLQKQPSQSNLFYDTTSGKPNSAPSSPTIRRVASFDMTTAQKRLTYHHADKNGKKGDVLDSLNVSNSSFITGVRRYKMLAVDELSSGSGESDDEANTSIKRIDMDLMGELQDIIFRKHSVSSERNNVTNAAEIKNVSKAQDSSSSPKLGFDDFFSPSDDVFVAAPIPPPRTKRKTGFLQNSNCTSETSACKNDDSLIRLESLDDDALFDPLKESNFRDTELLPFISPMKVTADNTISELKEKLQNMSSASGQPFMYLNSALGSTATHPEVAEQTKPINVLYAPALSNNTGNKSVCGAYSNLSTGKNNIKPCLPPEAKQSSSTFFVSTNELSRSKCNLLDEFGLANLQVLSQPVSNNCDKLHNSSSSKSEKVPHDLFNFKSSQVSGLPTDTKKSKTETWQKFI